MKKVSVLVLVLVMVVAMSTMVAAQSWKAGDFDVKVNVDVNGEAEVESDGSTEKSDVDTGYTIAGEYVVPYQDNVSFGAGLAYQFDRKIEGEGEFHFLPVYGLVKVQGQGKFAPYFVGHMGYNTLTIDDEELDTKGGMYYGFGGGMQVTDKLNAELLYTVNNGKVVDVEEVNIQYTKLSLGLSIPF